MICPIGGIEDMSGERAVICATGTARRGLPSAPDAVGLIASLSSRPRSVYVNTVASSLSQSKLRRWRRPC